jgi:hypothetical protein
MILYRGVELYRGPSRFNGGEIVVLATFKSDNEKTGNMIQVWILNASAKPTDAATSGDDQATCGECPMRNRHSGGEGLCYVNLIYTNGVYRSWQVGNYPKYDPKIHAKHFRGRVIRLGAYGDPAMVPASTLRPILQLSRGWTGYTHSWREPFAKDWKPYVMASVESEEGYQRAKAAGWRTFRIRHPGEPLAPRERMCPASPEGGHKARCEDCQVCDGADRGNALADISIIAHGKKGNAVRFTRLSISGRFAEKESPALQAA